ncbi:MAG: hypothetical protein QNJ16_18805 [Rhodobacter sp.]|nr:hypothetical protein [Rhodobacter sp.]
MPRRSAAYRNMVPIVSADEQMDTDSNQHLSGGIARIEDAFFDRRGLIRKREAFSELATESGPSLVFDVDGIPHIAGGGDYKSLSAGVAFTDVEAQKVVYADGSVSDEGPIGERFYNLRSESVVPSSSLEIMNLDYADFGNVRCIVYSLYDRTKDSEDGRPFGLYCETYRTDTGEFLEARQIGAFINDFMPVARVCEGNGFFFVVSATAVNNVDTWYVTGVTASGVIGNPVDYTSLISLWDNAYVADYKTPFFETVHLPSANVFALVLSRRIDGRGQVVFFDDDSLNISSIVILNNSTSMTSLAAAPTVSGGSVAIVYAEVGTSGNRPARYIQVGTSGEEANSSVFLGSTGVGAGEIQRCSLAVQSGSTAVAFWEWSDSDEMPSIDRADISGIGTSPSATTYQWVEQAQIAGYPVSSDGPLPVFVSEFVETGRELYEGTPQDQIVFLSFRNRLTGPVDHSDRRSFPVGRALYGRAHLPKYASSSPRLNRANAVPCRSINGRLAIPFRPRTDRTEFSSFGEYGVRFISLEEAVGADIPQAIKSSGGSIVDGAIPMEATPGDLIELGFIQYPSGIKTVVSPIGFEQGFYSYRLIYTHIDRSGNIKRSAPNTSDVTVEIPEGGGRVDISCPILAHTRAMTNSFVSIYRTLRSDSGPAPGPFYLVSTISMASVGATYDPANPSNRVVFTDSALDAEIADNEILYTDGNVVESIQPPPARAHCLWNNRHVIADAERPGYIVYSKKKQDGLAYEHGSIFELLVSDRHGEITGLYELSRQILVVFFERATYVIAGEGLDDVGGGQDIGPARLIDETVGSKSKHGISPSPMGVVFYSLESIHVLSRGAELNDIGENIRNEVVGKECVSCTLVPYLRMVQWRFRDEANTYCWCYSYNKWSIWRDVVPLSASVVDGSLWRLSGTTSLSIPGTLSSSTDRNHSMAIETRWINPSETVAGFSRLLRIYVDGYKLGGYDMDLLVGFDGEPEWREVRRREDTFFVLPPNEELPEFGPESFDGLMPQGSGFEDKAMLLEYALERTKMNKVRIRLEEVVEPGGSEGFAFSALSGLFVIKRGNRRRVPAGRDF